MTPNPRCSAYAALALLTACADPVGSSSAAVVYGEDGRTEVYAHPSAALRGVAESAIAMKLDEDVIEVSGRAVTLNYTRTLGVAKDLCAGERFAEQLEPGTCSGTLIDERYLLTAGHCMDTASDCTGSSWLFNFRYTADGELAPLDVDDVYSCARVIAFFDDDRVDHAVVELDRPVVGHAPVPLRVASGGLPLGTPLALIGHPNGIPMKIDSGGVVTENSSDTQSLRATLDAFNGNSGSGVFDHEGTMVAVLRGGETDYVAEGDCQVVNVIDPPPTDDGEALVYLRPAIEAFCATPGVDSSLCGCDGPCVEAPPGDSCAAAVELPADSQNVVGDLGGYGSSDRGSCGGAGPDRVYTFTVDAPTDFRARTTGFDSVLYLRAGCDGAELACNDDISDQERGSEIDATLAPGTYTLFVDAYDADIGRFDLALTLAPATPDAGPPPVDAGPPPSDAGASDAGPPGGTPSGGCHVTAQRDGERSAWLGLLLALGFVVWSRKR